MADVRSMLRAERAARRITHPHASYTSDGKLLCNLCEALVKSEAQWQSHLHSTQHTLRSQRAQDAKASRGPNQDAGSRKRKAETLEVESLVAVEKKRAKATESEAQLQDEVAGPSLELEHDAEDTVIIHSEQYSSSAPQAAIKVVDDLDEDDIAAFERQLEALDAEPEPATVGRGALDSAATISAAPMTAEQLAAQAREEASAQRGKRERELEEEREDVARAMEEEFEEMEGLEERVRKLRERREMLRKEELAASGGAAAAAEADRRGETNGVTNQGGEDVDNDDDDEDDEDEWQFGGS